MNIEVVLTENDPKLGQRGKVIKVSSGYAYNFLIPNKKAKLATASNLKSFDEEKARRSREEAEARSRAQELSKKIEALSLTLEMLAGEGEKLFGAVTTQDIQQALLSQGITLDKKSVHLEEPIKQLGAYTVMVKLHPEFQAKLKLWVVKKKN
jgi:large subunit ribosomal protein L9